MLRQRLRPTERREEKEEGRTYGTGPHGGSCISRTPRGARLTMWPSASLARAELHRALEINGRMANTTVEEPEDSIK